MTDSTADTASATDPEAVPPCPACASEYAYESGPLLVCPMCGHEWSGSAPTGTDDADHAGDAADAEIRDAVGNALADGDTVTLVKTVKVSGAGGGSIKVGTKVTGIRLVPGAADGHDIDARVPGFGKMKLKSSVVKRAG